MHPFIAPWSYLLTRRPWESLGLFVSSKIWHLPTLLLLLLYPLPHDSYPLWAKNWYYEFFLFFTTRSSLSFFLSFRLCLLCTQADNVIPTSPYSNPASILTVDDLAHAFSSLFLWYGGDIVLYGGSKFYQQILSANFIRLRFHGSRARQRPAMPRPRHALPCTRAFLVLLVLQNYSRWHQSRRPPRRQWQFPHSLGNSGSRLRPARSWSWIM